MEKGLPIGVAPNLHVSLVMLPDECRRLSPRRFPLQTLKLKAMSAVFRRQFARRLREPARVSAGSSPAAPR
jgi:hypothetical protein